jgi:hypothetical protein
MKYIKNIYSRREKNYKNKRDLKVEIRVNYEEKKLLKERANNSQMTISNFLIDSSLRDKNGNFSPLEREQIRKNLLQIKYQIQGVCANINQISHQVNLDMLKKDDPKIDKFYWQNTLQDFRSKYKYLKNRIENINQISQMFK